MKKTIFNIQIHLSEQQLKKLCELDGFTKFENLESYYEMAKNNPGHVYDDDPSYSNSLGASINDILSLGFAVMNAMEDYGYGDLKLKKKDLHFHPFRISYPVFTKVECEEKPFVNTSQYEPIGYALEKKSIE